MFPQDEFIDDLFNDMEGLFLMVAYNDRYNDEKYLELSRQVFKKYEKFVKYIILNFNMDKAYFYAISLLNEENEHLRKDLAESGIAHLHAQPEDLIDDPFSEYNLN